MIQRGERDVQGALLPDHLTEIRQVLDAGGFVMLPSDTAYSIATWPRTSETRRRVNELLDREESEPISLAFPSSAVIRTWSAPNAVADALLDCFTPGPITVVRTAARLIPVAVTRDLLGSLNHTIGTRVPNSVEERQVADVGLSPVTTVPVRDLSAERRGTVTSFAEAMTTVRDRSEAFEGAPWCAIEGDLLYPRTSTVVEVLGSGGSYTIRRLGVISEEEIQACIERLHQLGRARRAAGTVRPYGHGSSARRLLLAGWMSDLPTRSIALRSAC